MQSEFQKKKQDRDNKIVTAYQSLLGDGTPSTTAVNALSKKFGLTATSIFRIIKSNQQVAVAR